MIKIISIFALCIILSTGYPTENAPEAKSPKDLSIRPQKFISKQIEDPLFRINKIETTSSSTEAPPSSSPAENLEEDVQETTTKNFFSKPIISIWEIC